MPNSSTINPVRFNVLINLKSFDILSLKDSFLCFYNLTEGRIRDGLITLQQGSAPGQPTFQVKAMSSRGLNSLYLIQGKIFEGHQLMHFPGMGVGKHIFPCLQNIQQLEPLIFNFIAFAVPVARASSRNSEKLCEFPSWYVQEVKS